MSGGDRGLPADGALLRRVTASAVVLVLVLAGVSYRLDLGARLFGWDDPSPLTEPAEVLPPPGLELPPADEGQRPVAVPAPAPAADPRKVRRAIAPLVADKDLGPRIAVTVTQLFDGRTVYDTGPDRVTPASTIKLVTCIAALEALGPEHRFRTTVRTGTTPRDIVLVGGGDPLLTRRPPDPGEVYPARADLRTLAEATARALRARGRTTVRLTYDTSLFTGPSVSPAWRPSYIPDDVVSPISALWVDEGRARLGFALRSDDPAAEAARAFTTALRAQDITVRGRPRVGVAPTGSAQLASVASAPLGQVVQRILEVSDNEAAEVLFRHVAIAEGRPASFAGAARAVVDVLGRLGVDLGDERILDGSGLSRQNRLSPDTLVAVLELAASEEHPQLRSVAVDLPVAGFTGSLAYRFETAQAGLGRVRAKTGTLSGVHGLAGVVTSRDGVVLAFAAVADRVRIADTLDARAVLDEIAGALAGCRCATGAGAGAGASPTT